MKSESIIKVKYMLIGYLLALFILFICYELLIVPTVTKSCAVFCMEISNNSCDIPYYYFNRSWNEPNPEQFFINRCLEDERYC